MESSKRTTELNAINRLINAICDVNSSKRSKNYIRILRSLKDQILDINVLYADTLNIYNELIPCLDSKTKKELISDLIADENKRGISCDKKHKKMYAGYLYSDYLVKIATDSVTGKRDTAASTYHDLLVRVKEILMANTQESLVVEESKTYEKEIA